MELIELKDYGLRELEEQADWIMDQEPASIYELTDLTFESARLHGGLVKTHAQALEDMDSGKSLTNIFKFLNEMGVDMKTAAAEFDAQTIHTAMVEKDFIDYTESIYRDIDQSYGNDLTEQEKMLATILKIKDDNQMEFNTENRPEVQDLLAKTKKLDNTKNITVNKTMGKGMER